MTITKSRVVSVQLFSPPEESAGSPAAGTTEPTTTVASSATNARLNMSAIQRHRSRPMTEETQPGRIPCSNRVSNNAAGIAAASERLR